MQRSLVGSEMCIRDRCNCCVVTIFATLTCDSRFKSILPPFSFDSSWLCFPFPCVLEAAFGDANNPFEVSETASAVAFDPFSDTGSATAFQVSSNAFNPFDSPAKPSPARPTKVLILHD